jgi:hypothetical protein
LIQCFDRPASYDLSRRFETMPSSPIREHHHAEFAVHVLGQPSGVMICARSSIAAMVI